MRLTAEARRQLVALRHQRDARDTPVAVNHPPPLAIVDDPIGSADEWPQQIAFRLTRLNYTH